MAGFENGIHVAFLLCHDDCHECCACGSGGDVEGSVVFYEWGEHFVELGAECAVVCVVLVGHIFVGFFLWGCGLVGDSLECCLEVAWVEFDSDEVEAFLESGDAC
jgi:hypothetical protein